MIEVRNVVLYVAWLKDKNRRHGEMILDCLHVTAGSNKTEKDIEEYVLNRIRKTPESFSIHDVSVDNIDVTIIRLATIEEGCIETELME